MTQNKRKRGGQEKPDHEKLKPHTLRLNDMQWRKIEKSGGVRGLRKLIDDWKPRKAKKG